MKATRNHFSTISISVVSAMLACQSPFALAQADVSERTNYIVVGAVSLPEFEGAADQSTKPLIAASMRWGNRYVAWDGTNGRFNVLDHPSFELGPVINISFGRDSSIEPRRVRLLGEIDDAYEAGAFAAYNFADVLKDGDVLRLSLQGLQDVSDTHDGTIGEFAASYRMRISERLAMTATSSVSFADDDYADTYFSVSANGARISGLPAAKVEGGTKDGALSLSVNYDFNARWSLFGFVKASRLIGDFADSPIVELEGDKNQFSAGLGLGWRF